MSLPERTKGHLSPTASFDIEGEQGASYHE